MPVAFKELVASHKGDEEYEEYRSRLVAKEIKRDRREDLFAATPPLEAKTALSSLPVTGARNKSKPLKLPSIDVKKAYVYAPGKM